jgi:hypothetical protein
MPTSPGALVDTLTTTWKRVRAAVPELPEAHIAVVTTAPPADHGPERWSLIGGALQGLVIPAEILKTGPENVVCFLLHESAHVLNWMRGVKDTASRGYYHNEAYLGAAVEVGLEWSADRERDRTRGYPHPEMTAKTRSQYAPDVDALSKIIPSVLQDLTAPRGPKRASRPSFQCKCDPPRRIWTAQSTMDLGQIICGVCRQAFT